MCNDRKQFVEFCSLNHPVEVTLGDGHALEAFGRGIVILEMKLPDGKTKSCRTRDVLYVPKLSYNLLSVSRAADAGKMTKFNESSCQILDDNMKPIAVAMKVGRLYYLECGTNCQQINTVENQSWESKEQVWHRRFGHLEVRNLKKLAKDRLVDGFDYDESKEICFCESCAEGKHHRSQSPTSGCKRSEEPLGLVHSDVCGKMGAQLLSGAEYFLTFIDDKTHHVWMYVLNKKDQVFQQFLEWKALVERSTG